MKKLKFNYKNIVVLVISIITIFSTYFVASAQNLVEGNISPKSAFEIPTYPYDLQLKFDSKDDERWFKLVVNETKTIRLKIDGDSGFKYSLYRVNNSSDLECIYNNGNLYKDHYYKVKSGTYYISLKPYINDIKNKLTINFELLPEDKYEDNDTWQNATDVKFNNEYDFNLYGENDNDWFKFKLNETKTINLNIEGDHGFKYKLYKKSDLLTSTGQPIYSSSNFYGYHYYKLESGEYYVKLESYINDPESKLKLSIKLFDEDEYEDNDTWQNATQVDFNNEYDFNLHGENDSDWFKFKLDETKTINLNIEGDHGFKYKLYKKSDLLTSTGQPIYSSSNFYGYHYYKLESGEYYVKLESYINDPESKLKLSIKLFNEDEYENNDTWQKATVVESSKNYDFNLHADNDVDWFKIKVDESRSMKLNIEGDSGFRYTLYNGQELLNSSPKSIYSDGNFYGTHYYRLKPGEYYIKLSTYINDNESPLTLSVNLLEEDKYENNDTWQNAADFKLGEDKTITLNAPNDEDWFKLKLTQKESLKLKLDSSVSNSYRYYVYEQSSLQQGSTSYLTQGSVRTNGTAGGFSFDSGTYYVKLVNDSSSNKYESEIKMTINRNGEDIIRPTVTALSSSYNFDVNSSIEFEFSKPMDITTLNKSNISVKCYNDPIDFDIEYDEVDNKLILTPYNRLNYSSEYTVDISSKVKSRDNNLSMAKDYTWEFTTREKRASDSKVGIIKGNLILSDNLKGLAIAAKVELYSGNTKKTTVKVQSNGSYVINNVEPGTYTIKSKLPGFLDDSNRVTVTENNESKVNLTPVYGDSNNDGIIDIYDLTNTAVNYDRRSK